MPLTHTLPVDPVPPDVGMRGDWADEVRRLARRRDAVLLAHNY